MTTAGHKIVVLIPAYNEEKKITKTIDSVPDNVADRILVINDGSTDATLEKAQATGRVTVLTNARPTGVGNVIRKAIKYAKDNGFSILVIMAGNSKDDGSQIPLLTSPIINGEADFVQGSRFLKGGRHENMPLYRKIATKFVHPCLFSLACGKKITDSTNGFRAINMKLFQDPRINTEQDWLQKYELEPYLYFKAIKSGYTVKEVPVRKIYPPSEIGYTKMRPVIDWWSILKPIILLGLGLKK